MQARSINHWKSWVSIACNTKWAHTVQCSPYRHAASGKAVAQNRSYQISLHRVDTLVSPSLLHNCQSGGSAGSRDPRQVDCWDKIRVFHLALLRSSCSHLLTFASRHAELHVERKRHKLTNTSAELLWMCTQPHSIARIKYLGMSVVSDARSCPRRLARVHETLHGWCMSM